MLASCANISASTEVCKETDITPVSIIQQPTTLDNLNLYSFSETIDFSKTINSLSDLGDLKLFFTEDKLTTISGDLSWIQSIKIDIAGPVEWQYPRAPFASSGYPGKLKTLDFTTVMSGDTALKYFKSGPVMIFYTVWGYAPDISEVKHRICFKALVDGQKSL